MSQFLRNITTGTQVQFDPNKSEEELWRVASPTGKPGLFEFDTIRRLGAS
jgi:hypothetical protein